MCFQHAQKTHKVAIKKSTIPAAGDGLYWVGSELKNDTKKSMKLFPYARESDYLTHKEMDKKYPGDTIAVYGWCDKENKHCFDAKSTQSGYGRWINDKIQYGEGEPKLIIDKMAKDKVPYIYLRPGKKLNKNEELFVAYGVQYWNK
jgi:hypothetical protein